MALWQSVVALTSVRLVAIRVCLWLPTCWTGSSRPGHPNQKWVVDITYIATAQGWLYLAIVLDLYSRQVVGWSMQPRMTTDLVAAALRMALVRRCPSPGLLHHSDQGSQYASHEYQHLLAAHGIQVSMSRVGNCYDNAVVESFFATLKTECIDRRFATREEARAIIFDYIEVWYNRRRRHSTLGYLCQGLNHSNVQHTIDTASWKLRA